MLGEVPGDQRVRGGRCRRDVCPRAVHIVAALPLAGIGGAIAPRAVGGRKDLPLLRGASDRRGDGVYGQQAWVENPEARVTVYLGNLEVRTNQRGTSRGIYPEVGRLDPYGAIGLVGQCDVCHEGIIIGVDRACKL